MNSHCVAHGGDHAHIATDVFDVLGKEAAIALPSHATNASSDPWSKFKSIIAIFGVS